MATLQRVAVSLRRSPQPFKGLMLFWALAVVAELIGAIAGLGGGIRNGLLFAVGVAFALLGAALVLNVNGCADYMRDEIRRDAPYGYDYWRYAFAEGPGGVRLFPGVLLLGVGAWVMVDLLARAVWS